MLEKAIEKIDLELKNFKGNIEDKAILNNCAEVLKEFCTQKEEFAQAVIDNDKSIEDYLNLFTEKHMEEIKAKCGVEADLLFNEMVQFYKSGAKVRIKLELILEDEPESALNFNIADFVS